MKRREFMRNLMAAGAGTFAAAFYGEVPDELDGVCPVVAGYGARDRVYGEHGQRLERRLEALGVAHDVVTYPDAGHSFMG